MILSLQSQMEQVGLHLHLEQTLQTVLLPGTSNIDTATSLGLAKWVDGTNYYRPYNGGRVVNWVDENGEIKTSVNVMPPNAKSIADSGTLSNATAKSNGSAPNDNFRPTFEAHTSSLDEDLLSEVAKTFHYREFGNGSY